MWSTEIWLTTQTTFQFPASLCILWLLGFSLSKGAVARQTPQKYLSLHGMKEGALSLAESWLGSAPETIATVKATLTSRGRQEVINPLPLIYRVCSMKNTAYVEAQPLGITQRDTHKNKAVKSVLVPERDWGRSAPLMVSVWTEKMQRNKGTLRKKL